MELKAMELPLAGFGAAATPARVEILTLSSVDRIKRAAGTELHGDGALQAPEEDLLLFLPASADARRAYQRTAALPHRKPDPNAVMTRRSPR
jgi:hypothetical protein